MSATGTSIQRFVADRTLAIVGVSAAGKGFGNAAYTELKKRGYRVLPVHPTATTIQGDRCWPNLAAVPERVERLLVCVKPDRADAVVHEAAAAGVRQIWFQQGAESAAAIEACAQRGVDAVHGQCILMFAEPVGSFHKFHRFVWKLIGRLPG